MRRIVKYLVVAVVVFMIAGQFARPDLNNPPVNPASTFESVAGPSPELVSVLKRSCYDCHSNTTVWPWYSRVAPVSWLVADDVKDGRARLNFSEWAYLSPEMAQKRLEAACKEAKNGEMPLWQYQLIHSGTKLTDQEIAILCGMSALKR